MRLNKLCRTMIGFSLLLFSCSPLDTRQEKTDIKHTLSDQVPTSYEVAWEKFDITVFDNRSNSMIVTVPNKVILEGKQENDAHFYIFAFNTLDGSLIWQTEVKSSPSQLLASDLVLYRGAGGIGRIQAYNINNGQLLWETVLPGAHSVIDLYSFDGKLFANTNDNAYFIVDEDGVILESKTTDDRIFYETDSTIYLGKSAALEAKNKYSGAVDWHLNLAGGFQYSPIFDKGTIYLRTDSIPNNIIYSIDQSSGGINWQLNTHALSNLYSVGSQIYFLSVDGHLISLDCQSGKEIERVGFSPAFELNGYGYVGRYYISVDTRSNVIVVSFGDSTQILGIKTAPLKQ